MKIRTHVWLQDLADWLHGVEPRCPLIESPGQAAVAVEAGRIRRCEAEADPYDAVLVLALAHAVVRPAGIRALILALMGGDAPAFHALGEIVEGRVQVVE